MDASIERRRLVPRDRFIEALQDYGYPVTWLVVGGWVFLEGTKVDLRAFSPAAVFFFLLVVVFPSYWIYASYRSYRFIRWDVLGSQEELRERVLDAIEHLHWSAMEDDPSVVVAYNRAGIMPGQAITILLRPNALYVNSRNRSGSRSRSPFSFGRHARNVRMLRAALAIEGSVVPPLEP